MFSTGNQIKSRKNLTPGTKGRDDLPVLADMLLAEGSFDTAHWEWRQITTRCRVRVKPPLSGLDQLNPPLWRVFLCLDSQLMFDQTNLAYRAIHNIFLGSIRIWVVGMSDCVPTRYIGEGIRKSIVATSDCVFHTWSHAFTQLPPPHPCVPDPPTHPIHCCYAAHGTSPFLITTGLSPWPPISPTPA